VLGRFEGPALERKWMPTRLAGDRGATPGAHTRWDEKSTVSGKRRGGLPSLRSA
jgi:hypothetical protein